MVVLIRLDTNRRLQIHMGRKTIWRPLSDEQRTEVEDLMPPKGSYRIWSQSQIPSIFSPSFREKMDSALAIATETSTGGTYLVAVASRVDFKDRAIDQEPFGIIVHSTGAGASRVFLHNEFVALGRRPSG